MQAIVKELNDAPRSHDVKLWIVPSESIEGANPHSFDRLKDKDGNVYNIIDLYTYKRNEPEPQGLFWLATGKDVDIKKVWDYYEKSDTIYFYIIKPHTDD